MKPLIEQLYEAHDVRSIKKLALDTSSQKLIKDAIACKLMDSNRILVGNELNQLVLLCSQARFASTEEETLAVPAMIFCCLKSTDILPSLACHRGKAFAARALVSLSFFRKAMEAQYHRHAAPKPEYYQRVAITYLHQADLDNVADHFDSWVGFLGEHLV